MERGEVKVMNPGEFRAEGEKGLQKMSGQTGAGSGHRWGQSGCCIEGQTLGVGGQEEGLGHCLVKDGVS